MTKNQMGPRRPHRAKWTDPLVPLYSERLRAAMELGGWTVTRLAKRLGKGEHPQTVHHLQLGDGLKRCRASRLAALARILEVPEAWLAGADYVVPLIGVLPLTSELARSQRLILAVGRLLERCVAAVKRDLERELERPSPPAELNARHEVHGFMASAMGHLLSPLRWQARLVPLTKPEDGLAQGGPIPDLAPVMWLRPQHGRGWSLPVRLMELDLEHEAAALGLVQAWTVILGPWLEGKAALDYRRFLDLAAVLNPTARTMYPTSWHYRQPADELPPALPTSPYALVDWPLARNRSSDLSAERKEGAHDDRGASGTD